MRAAIVLFIVSVAASSWSADAPTAAQLEARLEVLSLKRQKIFADYRMGELLMKNAQLEDQPLKAEEDALKNQLEAIRKTAKP